MGRRLRGRLLAGGARRRRHRGPCRPATFGRSTRAMEQWDAWVAAAGQVIPDQARTLLAGPRAGARRLTSAWCSTPRELGRRPVGIRRAPARGRAPTRRSRHRQAVATPRSVACPGNSGTCTRSTHCRWRSDGWGQVRRRRHVGRPRSGREPSQAMRAALPGAGRGCFRRRPELRPTWDAIRERAEDRERRPVRVLVILAPAGSGNSAAAVGGGLRGSDFSPDLPALWRREMRVLKNPTPAELRLVASSQQLSATTGRGPRLRHGCAAGWCHRARPGRRCLHARARQGRGAGVTSSVSALGERPAALESTPHTGRWWSSTWPHRRRARRPSAPRWRAIASPISSCGSGHAVAVIGTGLAAIDDQEELYARPAGGLAIGNDAATVARGPVRSEAARRWLRNDAGVPRRLAAPAPAAVHAAAAGLARKHLGRARRPSCSPSWPASATSSRTGRPSRARDILAKSPTVPARPGGSSADPPCWPGLKRHRGG